MDLIKTQVNEVQEMEPMVLNDLSKIEDGLIALDNQISIGESGRPDILAVDADGSLVVIELKSVPAGTDALEQSLRYYEWFSENMPLLARPFPQINPQNYVRVLLIAPEFNDGLIRIAKYLDIEIALIRSIPLKDKETENIGIYYEYIDLERSDESTVEFRSVEDVISYISDSQVKEEFLKVLDKLKEYEVNISSWRGGKTLWIECKYRGEEIGYLQTRRRFFNCQYYDEETDDWSANVKCYTYQEWQTKCEEKFSDYLKTKA